MKKIIFIVSVLLVFTLSSCTHEEIIIEELFEYSDFEDIALDTHVEAETMSEGKYIVYYYSPTCSHCQEVKQEILLFASEFSTLDFYILDTSITTDKSSLPEFVGTPTIFIFSGTKLIEQYIGITRVRTFISEYEDLELTYDYFLLQKLVEYSEVDSILNDIYLLYLYSDDCFDCVGLEDELLPWAFRRNINDILFLDTSNISDPSDLPPVYDSISPLLIVMSNGVPTDEYYLGSLDIINYLILIGDGDITPQN